MQAQIIVAPARSQISLETMELPPVGPDEVLVETLYSSISPGTELAFLHGKPNTPGHYPFYPGYSACGRILETGSNVQGLSAGQLVACQSRHASHVVVAADRCTPLPAGLDPQDAAPFRLVSITLQGVRKAQLQLGWSVGVIGLGPIGNLAGQWVRTAGAGEVIGIDPIGWRRNLALEVGFDTVAESAAAAKTEPGFEAVLESAGVPQTVPMAFDLAAPLGHVVLLASTRGETESVNFYRDIHRKGLVVIGAHDIVRPQVDNHLYYMTRQADDAVSLKMIAKGRIKTGPLISDVVSPQEASSAYDRLTKRDEELMLIVFKWQD